MRVVGFYTKDTPYEDEAVILQRSLERVGMPYEIVGLRDAGSWDANTAKKSRFLKAAREVHTGPLLYVDVDAFVHEDCAPYFDGLARQGYDFGAHWFAGPSTGHDWSTNCACLAGRPCSKEHRFLSGTLFLGDTDPCRKLLTVWCALNDACGTQGWRAGGGQRNLWALLKSQGRHLKTVDLPGRYCYVFDKPRGYPADEPKVIEHTIASRDHRLGMGRRRSKERRARRKELINILNEGAT